MELLWVVPLVPLWQIYSLAIMNQNFLMKRQTLPYTVVTLMTPFLFSQKTEFQKFLNCLNSLHPSLKFTNEIETINSLPFLDVLVTKPDNKFITSVYRKPTFIGQYIHWNSFGLKQRKTNLIDTLTHRALKICSKSTLKHKLDNIRSILVKNGYPEFLIDVRTFKKLLRFEQSTKEGPKKCSVYLKLPWIGKNSLKFERKIKLFNNNCFRAVKPRVVFSTRRILPAIHKDVLPTFQQSNVVYEYVCHCDSRYVGQTSQRLQDRIRQHVPKSIRNRTIQGYKQSERPGKLHS